jgi:ABC-type branched-subunit amino acid transport system ATPase component
VAPGAICGLIGPNGAGKTSMLNCITHAYRPDSGHITFDGRTLLRTSAHHMVRQGIARTFQNLELFTSMSVLDNVLVGDHTGIERAFLSAGLNAPRVRRSEAASRDRVDGLTELIRRIREEFALSILLIEHHIGESRTSRRVAACIRSSPSTRTCAWAPTFAATPASGRTATASPTTSRG